jgi:CRP/FNR family cyclic AMP-dependent transcriptional regulator
MDRPEPVAQTDVLNEAVIRQIAEQGKVRRYPAGSIIINEDDPGEAIFIILSGRVKTYSVNAAGREVIYNTHGPGEYLGEISLDGGTRSASVVTLEPTTCSIVQGAELREFMRQHPEFAEHLVLKLIRLLRRSTLRVKSLALMDVYGRVAQLINTESELEDGVRIVRERYTQQDIADRVGSSREMVSRILKDLTLGGYISVTGRRIVVHRKLPDAW